MCHTIRVLYSKGLVMEINIEHLTPEQKEMLEFMWNEIEDLEDYERWFACLDEAQQEQAVVLQRLIIMEMMEELLEDTSEASQYLKKFTLQ